MVTLALQKGQLAQSARQHYCAGGQRSPRKPGATNAQYMANN
jgi:hypothetical protein